MSKQNLSQTEKLAELLQGIKGSITAQDRRDAEAATGLSRVTIHRYLSGMVYDADLGLKLLEFLTERVNQREMKIKELAA